MFLVTGATGRLGGAVVRALRSQGRDVRALVRKGSEYYWLNDTSCRYFFGDLRDPESLGRAMEGARVLVVCSGVRLEERNNHHGNVTIEGHRALFETARARGVERLLLLSCLSAPAWPDVYGAAQRAALEGLARDSGIPTTILRAPAHEHPFIDLAWTAKRAGRAQLPARGENLLSLLPADDVGRAMAAAVDRDDLIGATVDLAGEAPITARAAFELAARVAGVPAEATVLPQARVTLATHLGRPLRRFAHRLAADHAWFSRELLADPAATRDLLGGTFTPLEEAMAAGFLARVELADPELREKRMVHPQFYATVYQPGEARLADLPAGPPQRRS